jgi:hypothetical protein
VSAFHANASEHTAEHGGIGELIAPIGLQLLRYFFLGEVVARESACYAGDPHSVRSLSSIEILTDLSALTDARRRQVAPMKTHCRQFRFPKRSKHCHQCELGAFVGFI